MITPSSSNPMLTELGRANVFRVQNRDDAVVGLGGRHLRAARSKLGRGLGQRGGELQSCAALSPSHCRVCSRARLARSGGSPDRRGRPDDGQGCLVRRADGARRGAGRGRPQRRRRRARPAGAADHGGRLLRSRAGGRRRQEAGQRRCDLRRRTLLLRGLDPGIGNLRGGGSPADLAGVDATRC